MKNNKKKEEILNRCIKLFVKRGVFETSIADIARELGMPKSGLYYYYASRDELVMECARAAADRVEGALVKTAEKNIEKPENFIEEMRKTADKVAPLRRFVVNVLTSPKYAKEINAYMEEFPNRYRQEAQKIAGVLECSAEELETAIFACAAGITNYMIYQRDDYVLPIMESVVRMQRELLDRRNGKSKTR